MYTNRIHLNTHKWVLQWKCSYKPKVLFFVLYRNLYKLEFWVISICSHLFSLKQLSIEFKTIEFSVRPCHWLHFKVLVGLFLLQGSWKFDRKHKKKKSAREALSLFLWLQRAGDDNRDTLMTMLKRQKLFSWWDIDQ